MAKMNPNLKNAAKMGGVRIPPKPMGQIKTPDQIKKQAKAQTKARVKRLIKVLIVLGVLLVVGLIVYFVKFYGKMPKDAFNKCVGYAYENQVVKFRDCFTTDTVEMIESSEENHDEDWNHLIDGITPNTRPSVKKETIKDDKGAQTAEMRVMIDGVEQSVFMRKEEGKWKINLNVALNPHKITLPDDIPPEYIDNFDVSDEPESWWEEEVDEDGNKKDKNNSFFNKLIHGKLFKK